MCYAFLPLNYNAAQQATQPHSLAKTANKYELDQVNYCKLISLVYNLIMVSKQAISLIGQWKTTYHSRSLISPSSSCDIWTGRRDLIWLKPTHISATSFFVLLLIMYVFCNALMSSPMLSYCRTNKLKHKITLYPQTIYLGKCLYVYVEIKFTIKFTIYT